MGKIIFIGLGIVILVVLALAAAMAIGRAAYDGQIKREVAGMFKNRQEGKAAIVTEEDIARLPEPVQRWLRNSGIIGKERVTAVRLKQKGFFRMKEGGNWMPFTAEEYYTTNPPAFIWKAQMSMVPFLTAIGRDRYESGKGELNFKLGSLITVADAQGSELDQGAMVRYLNEIMWFPSAAISDYITWEAVDSSSARATMSFGGVTASAIFYFNEKGEETNMTADRYATLKKGISLEKWSTPIAGYGEFQGLRVPSRGEGVWNLKTGDYPYIRVEVTEIEYNKPALY